ncbi:hypothetical protein PFICI_02157 [Pestalotiopsis fici W106-1]|uniref:Xylanolytic transcriptional activator regulatory domain-containing protein n=1 Tax=Pestalotiopsis fici (strain W106-1 / CGMCC3.15140) TaxID=1229662 RepID=W3XFC5_PESFW|nr:uncharacterized protein PFICI_02157 [Pestalotiopsis fici W106-1]ETS84132.1 hypothetical protein PFICI_02157 [Pestalotiopsis fici W106-1]
MPTYMDDAPTVARTAFDSVTSPDGMSSTDIHVNAYFEYFHPALPLVHRSTFLTSSPPKLLVDIIVAIGLLYSAETPGLGHAKAACVKKSQSLWRQGVDELNRRASYDWRELRKTWMMQSWLLHIVYGAFMDNASHAERVRKMLRSLVDAVRDLGLLKQVVATSANSPVWPQMEAESSEAAQAVEAYEQWQIYISEESLKLSIYTLLLLDHHVFSCANIRPLISTVECLWELPLAESLWEAETAEAWYERRCQHDYNMISGSPRATTSSFKGFLSTATQSLLSETQDASLLAMLARSSFAMMCVLSNLDALVKDFTRCYYQLPPSPADPSAFHILTQSQTRQICSALSVLSAVVKEKVGSATLEADQSVWHACQILTWSLKLSLCRPDDLLVGGIVENRVFASLVTATHLTVDSYVTFKRTTHAAKQRNDEGDGMIAVIDDLTEALSAIAALDARLALRESPWITAASYRLLLTVWRTLHVATADIYEKLNKCNGTLTSRSFGSSILILNSILETVTESSKQRSLHHSPGSASRRLWSFDADMLNLTLAQGETDLVNLIVQICKSRSVWVIGPSLVNAVQDAMANAAR